MISLITITILGIFGIICAIFIIGFILLMRQSNERPKRYKARRKNRKDNDVATGYIPYSERPQPEVARRESMVVLGFIILFIVLSILVTFLF